MNYAAYWMSGKHSGIQKARGGWKLLVSIRNLSDQVDV